MKEALIAAAVYGEGNSSVQSNPEAIDVFQGFQSILRQLLPQSIGFQRLTVRAPEIVMMTNTGVFPIDAISGGVSAIMELAWQVFLRARLVKRFVVCIDEPENHLHPELQRLLLPRMVQAFPNVQFVVSTHSPFIVSSVADASVYVLRFSEVNMVESELLDMANRAGSAGEVLREVLGVSTTIPVWAEVRLQEIVERYSHQNLTAEALQLMREELHDLGLDEVTPEVVANVFRRTKPQDDQVNKTS